MRTDLPDVTVVAIDTIAHDKTLFAIEKTLASVFSIANNVLSCAMVSIATTVTSGRSVRIGHPTACKRCLIETFSQIDRYMHHALMCAAAAMLANFAKRPVLE